jgi:dihydrofolate reductase
MSKVFGGMAASLDMYIQSTNKDLSWLNDSMAKDEDYGIESNMKRTGAYIMGANTYREFAAGGGGGDTTPTYILTHDKSLKTNKTTHLYSGDLEELIGKIKSEIPEDKDICVYGGGDIITQFIDQDLMDEIGLSIIPVILGDGIPFFKKIKDWKKLELTECKHYKSGIVILYYKFKK